MGQDGKGLGARELPNVEVRENDRPKVDLRRLPFKTILEGLVLLFLKPQNEGDGGGRDGVVREKVPGLRVTRDYYVKSRGKGSRDPHLERGQRFGTHGIVGNKGGGEGVEFL